ncbi:MAG: response regulator [Bacteroidia bacterium]
MGKIKKQDEAKVESVLLIDEDQIDNFINERMIVAANFAKNVIVKNSAQKALDYLRETIEKNGILPELIFLDLHMPVMDGFAFLEALEKERNILDKILPRTKIIVLSSSISPTDIDRASENPNVYKYLNKPLTEKYLNAINI